MKPRCWEYSRNPRVSRGCRESAPATAAGKLSMTRYFGMPPKKAQAASRPAITSSSLWPKVGPQEAVPGVSQHHQQGPHRPPAAALLVLDVAQAAEVQLRHFPGRGVLHPHRSEAAPPPVAPLQESPQRRVGHNAAPQGQQFLDAGQLETVNGDPLVDLVAPGLQLLLGRSRFFLGTGPAQRRQLTELLLGGCWPFLAYAKFLRRRYILADRISRQPGS